LERSRPQQKERIHLVVGADIFDELSFFHISATSMWCMERMMKQVSPCLRLFVNQADDGKARKGTCQGTPIPALYGAKALCPCFVAKFSAKELLCGFC
jgi:hypothetical protein